MNDEENKGQSPCCQGGDCCSQAEAPRNKRGNRWKALIFAAVILLACAVSAYSLFRQRPAAVGSGCCPPGSAASSGIGKGATAEGLGEMLAGANLALIVFPRTGDSLPPYIGAALDSVKAEIGIDKPGLQLLTLYRENPAYIVAINQYNIDEYPAVLALGNNCNRVLTQSAINRDLMLDLYRQSAAAGPACCPTGNTAK